MQKWHVVLIAVAVITLVWVLGPAGTRRIGEAPPVIETTGETDLPASRLITAAVGRDATLALSSYQALERIGRCPYLADSLETPIGLLAAAYGQPGSDPEKVEAVIRLLVQQGCDINQYNATGLTPTHAAILSRQPALLVFLTSLGADPLLRVIDIPGRASSRRMAHLDAYGLARQLARDNPDNAALQEIIGQLQPNT